MQQGCCGQGIILNAIDKPHTKRFASLSRDPTTTIEPAAGWSGRKKAREFAGAVSAAGCCCNLIATATLVRDKCCGQAASSTWWHRAMAGLAGVVTQLVYFQVNLAASHAVGLVWSKRIGNLSVLYFLGSR